MTKLVPQVRFKGFDEAWESRKLGEIVNRLSKTSDSELLPKIEFEDIKAGEGTLNKDISHKFDSRKGILFESGDILYGKLRPYLKNWLLANFSGIALGDFWVLRAVEGIQFKFLYVLIQGNTYQSAANDTSGTKMPRSDWKKVSSTFIKIPLVPEQQQIGSLFQKLDTAIELQQKQLDAQQQFKKAMLQKMFPKKGAKVPEIRFAGFEDEWEEILLSDALIVSKEKKQR